MLVKYLRDGNRPIGCIVAVDRDHVGFSLCNDRDHFNRIRAKEIAERRALMGVDARRVYEDSRGKVKGGIPIRLVNNPYATCQDENISVPLVDYVNSEIALMEDRAKRYFKSDKEIFG